MSAWLVSRRFDLTFVVAPAIVGLVLGARGGRHAGAGGETPVWAWVGCVLLVDVAHVHATTVRVYLDPSELRRRPALYVMTPLLALLVSLSVHAASPALFWRLLAYLAAFHFVRQQVGFGRLYRRRLAVASRLDDRLTELALYAATLYPLLAWHTRLPQPFAWLVPGDFTAGLPSICERLGFWAWLTLLGAFAARTLWQLARQEPVSLGLVLLVATTALTWWCGIVLWATDFAFTVTNTLAHGVPYMAIAHRVGAHHAQPRRQGLRALFVPRRLWLYAGVLGALAYVEEWLWDGAVWHEQPGLFLGSDALPALGAAVPLLALPQLTHYLLDAYLWRARDNPDVARAFALGAPPAVEAAPLARAS